MEQCVWAMGRGDSSTRCSQLEIKAGAASPPVSHSYILKGGESKEQNKCQTCRCANKSKLEQEKKIMLYPFNLCFTLANSMTQPRFLAELHAVSLNGATRKCRGHLQSLLWLCCCLAGWHRLQELQSCSQLLKDGERKRIQTLSQKLILLPVMSTISYFSHKKSFRQSTVLASGFSKKH